MKEFELFLVVVVVLFVSFVVVLVMLQRANQNQLVREIQRQQEGKTHHEWVDIKTHIVSEVFELKEKVNQDLLAFQGAMSRSVKEDIHRLSESTTQRIGSMETKMNESMEKGLKTTYESFSKVMEQMARIDQTQKNLDQLSHQINALQSVLTDKKHRGIFGEVELYSLLELQFGVNERRYQKQYKLQSGRIADAVLFAPEPLGMIAIDSKFPLENYNRMYDSNRSKAEQDRARSLFRQDVLGKINDIASKYIVPGETASFAYMFIPAEAVFAEIYGRFEDVISHSYEAQVYLVSPTTLMAYLTAIQAIYLGQERDEKMDLMRLEFVQLGKEFSRFESRWDQLGKDFKRTHQDFHEVSVTTSKLMQRFRNIKSLQLTRLADEEQLDEELKFKQNDNLRQEVFQDPLEEHEWEEDKRNQNHEMRKPLDQDMTYENPAIMPETKDNQSKSEKKGLQAMLAGLEDFEPLEVRDDGIDKTGLDVASDS